MRSTPNLGWLAVAAFGLQAVTAGLTFLLRRRGPGQRIAATRIVEQIEPLLQKNVDAYFDGPRTVSTQRQALDNFDRAWTWLTSLEGCGNPDLGNAGVACIDDRRRGGKFDWFALYRDPIANDTPQPDTAIVTAHPWLLPALLILGGLLL